MKRSYSLKVLSLLLLFSSFSLLTNAVTRDTKTGQIIPQGNVSASTPGGPLSLPSGTIVNTNNGWNNTVLTSIGEDGSDYYAQSFIANVTAITSFGVVIQELSAEGQISLAIAADNGGVPNYAAPLYAGT
ncbi:MAG: hypothetical protein GXX78_03755 [Bacteroidales bacterium]|nr:hypothetical protein [Bacteroidales bacterium]